MLALRRTPPPRNDGARRNLRCRRNAFERQGDWCGHPEGSLGSHDLPLRPRGVGMASISERENGEIEAANASGTTPVVFIHGLWLLPSSWANWTDFFEQAGYAP